MFIVEVIKVIYDFITSVDSVTNTLYFNIVYENLRIEKFCIQYDCVNTVYNVYNRVSGYMGYIEPNDEILEYIEFIFDSYCESKNKPKKIDIIK